MLDALRRPTAKFILQTRIRKALRGRYASIVSSNCLVGRLSQIAGEPYRSPTVGLWFRPEDFLKFVSDLPRYSSAELTHDVGESQRMGHPVGSLADITIMFTHYASFAEAHQKWIERVARINVVRLLLVHTDRGGASSENLSAFEALPYPKLLFVSKPIPSLKSALWVRHGNEPDQVGDLTTHWHHLLPVLSGPILRSICNELDCRLGAADSSDLATNAETRHAA